MKDALQQLTGKPVGHNGTWIYLEEGYPEVEQELVLQAEQLVVERNFQQLCGEVREERDYRLKDVYWRIQRHEDELSLGVTVTEPIEPVRLYVQELRDVPAQEGFPTKVTWPVAPPEPTKA